jgi:PadR family transcriptional regulator, regulatory protein PadR
MKTQESNEQVVSLSQELRRGILPLAVLSLLKEKKYGYALIGDLAAAGIEVDQGTLYPMLRRLEAQALLESSWVLEGTRPRRYYVINEQGSRMVEVLSQEWKKLNQLMEKLLGEIPV